MKKSKALPIKMPWGMYQKLKAYSGLKGQPMAHVVREAIAAHLKENFLEVDQIHPTWGGVRKNQTGRPPKGEN